VVDRDLSIILVMDAGAIHCALSSEIRPPANMGAERNRPRKARIDRLPFQIGLLPTAGTTVQFRYRVLTKAGEGDWSQPASLPVK
jgi:hypothetical protein